MLPASPSAAVQPAEGPCSTSPRPASWAPRAPAARCTRRQERSRGLACQAGAKAASALQTTYQTAPRPEQPPQLQPPPQPQQEHVQGPWLQAEAAEEARKSREILQGEVVGHNRGGILVYLHKVRARAFVPMSAIDKVKVQMKDSSLGWDVLMSTTLDVIVTDVDRKDRRIFCSEVRARMTRLAASLQVGQWVDVVVDRLVDRGAFVLIKTEDGRVHGEVGKIPLKELSWNFVRVPENVVQVGQELRARVVMTDPPRSRIYLSLKEEQENPLQQTLDALLPDGVEPEAGAPLELPPAMEDVYAALQGHPRISGVTLGRQVEEKAVSQDLEVYIRRASTHASGFDLVARAGRQVQEIHVNTDLTADEMKQTVQDIVARIL